jgi:NAD(P)-dependent dehydrogenase (short-subunit alcohol dehydrogenase family)
VFFLHSENLDTTLRDLDTSVHDSQPNFVAKAVLAKGDKVAGTSRNLQDLVNNIGMHDNFLPLQVDITSDEDVKNNIEKVVTAFGRIDVVLNNAGYYLVGSLEEVSEEEFRQTIAVNLFGTVNVIRNSMPHLRRQQSGYIINISSNMGYVGFANTGSYNAGKFAVVGLTEALAQEAAPFGIRATVVVPGMFRTSFMTESTLAVAKNRIPAYGVDEHEKMLRSMSGNQPGDPQKLANVLIQLAEMPAPPLHLPLGGDSYQLILEQRKKEAVEMEQWKQLSFSTNFA